MEHWCNKNREKPKCLEKKSSLYHTVIPYHTWTALGVNPGELQCYSFLLCSLKRAIHSQLNWAILLLRHTWWKNRVNCAVLKAIEEASELPFPVVFHTQKCAVHSGNPTVSSVHLPTQRWHHLKAHPFLAIHSADEHRMIYAFSNTTSYSTFYAFFSSFRITLWPMWLANSKRQPCFYPP